MRKKPKTNLRVRMGSNIRGVRERQDLSLRKLGLMTGVDYKYLHLIEHGEANPSVDELERIAKGLDVDLRDLF